MSEIKHDHEKYITELWIDDDFHAGWSLFDIPEDIEGRICRMIDYAVEVGERRGELKKVAEIRKALGLGGSKSE